MGLYRLVLAFMVMLSHAGIGLYEYNLGVVAVISFFILSGYVMSILIYGHYSQPSDIPDFYLDRATRLFPQFLFYMLATLLCVLFLQIDFPGADRITNLGWLFSFMMLPLGYYMYWADGVLVMPQAWSLGLELSFYLVIPWLLISISRNGVSRLAYVSFAIFLLACSGGINTDHFGYRLLPGTIFMFLIGWFFYLSDAPSRQVILIFLLSVVALFLVVQNSSLYMLPYNKEVLVGLAVGICMVGMLSRMRFSRVDEFLGNLSYGVFLNHFLLIWLIKQSMGIDNLGIQEIFLLMALSGSAAAITFFLIERPFLKLRRNIRNRQYLLVKHT